MRFWFSSTAVLTLALITPAFGYEQDTHYGLTYYLARQAGYIPENAHRIADFAWNIDVNSDTEPARPPIDLVKNIPLVSGVALLVQVKLRPEQISVLRSFHAFPDTIQCGREDNVDNITLLNEGAQIPARENAMLAQADQLGNPGFFLHYFEDKYSHAGFPCGTRGEGHAPLIHAPDYLDRKKNIAQAMATGVLGKLSTFMTKNHLGTPCDPDTADVQHMVQKMAAINEAPTRADTFSFVLLGLIGDWALGQGPEYDKAKPILDAGLPKGEPVPEFRLQHLTARPIGDNYENAFPNHDERVQDQNGAVFLANEVWRAKSGKRVKFTIASNPDPNALDLLTDTGHNWDFVSYDPKAKEWTFDRKPADDELPKPVPKTFISQDTDDWNWALGQVRDKLRLHLVMHLETPSCKVKGKYYRGVWRYQVDPKTGQKRAWVPDGRDGWGFSEDYDLERDFRHP